MTMLGIEEVNLPTRIWAFRLGFACPCRALFQLLGLLLLKDQIKLNCLALTYDKQSKRVLLEVIFSQV